MAKKQIAVLGAGFGGMQAALDIARGLERMKKTDAYEVILIDQNDCHVYTPVLYRLAASSDLPRTACTYDLSSLTNDTQIRFIQDRIVSVDIPTGIINLANIKEIIRPDWIVLALGSETNFFNIPGMQEYALQLKTLESALAIRDAVQSAFSKKDDVKILVGGGGPNGIELAAELEEWACLIRHENSNRRISITLIEAMPTILNGFDAAVVSIATDRLKKLNVTVELNAKITSVNKKTIHLEGKTDPVDFDVFIWTGGIKASTVTIATGIEKDPKGRPLAAATLKCNLERSATETYPSVYAIGDNVTYMNTSNGKPAPAVAPVAIQEAKIAAKNILREIMALENPQASKTAPDTFHPPAYPYVIPIGKNWALGKIGLLVFWGWAGAIFEKLIALDYLMSLMPLRKALATWKTTQGILNR